MYRPARLALARGTPAQLAALLLALNGERLYTGDDPALASALFGIWLGDRPLRDDFRDALLGRR